MPDAGYINLKSLKYFMTVAQTGNIGRAATILDIHPGSLGRSIATFEKELGIQLYFRYSRGIVLTDKGKDLLEIGAGLIKNAERIFEIAGKPPKNQTLTVGIPLSLAPHLIGPIYDASKMYLPNIALSFVEAESLDIETKTIGGSIDISLMYNPPEVSELISFSVLSEALLLVYPPNWKYTPPSRPVLVRELQQLPMVLAKMGLSERRYLAIIEQQSGMRLSPVIEASSSAAINSVVNRGIACTIALSHSVAQEAMRGSLLTHPIGKPSLKMSLCVVAAKGAYGIRDVSTLTSVIGSTIQGLVRDGKWANADLAAHPDMDIAAVE